MEKKGSMAPVVTILLVAIVLIAIYGIFQQMGPKSDKIKLETNHGDIVIELYDDMPITAGNFKKLVEEGFYDGILFHRIIDGFVIQGGDPLTKDPEKKDRWGTGGRAAEFHEGFGNPDDQDTWKIPDQFNDKSNVKYSLSMANAGPDTGSSQFFINLQDNVLLDGRHPVFGEVVEGKDVVDAIAKVETGAGDVPVGEVVILSASVV